MTPSDPAVREAEERLERLRAFIQDSLDLGHDRATIGNLMSARDEVDAATPLVAALRARAEAAERARDEWKQIASRDNDRYLDQITETEAAEARANELEKRVEAIGRRARSDGDRTFDECIRALGYIDDLCRTALAPQPEAPADQDGETGR